MGRQPRPWLLPCFLNHAERLSRAATKRMKNQLRARWVWVALKNVPFSGGLARPGAYRGGKHYREREGDLAGDRYRRFKC